MLDEPYRWVEAIRNRREYLADQLKSASPVVGCAYENGLLLLTTTTSSHAHTTHLRP